MDKMHADMMASQYTGNADVDFVRGMIPHHRGAIDMAKVELAKVEPATTQVATAANVAQPAASAASSQPSAAPPASRPDERSGMGLTWYVAIAVLIALALIVFMRRRKRP